MDINKENFSRSKNYKQFKSLKILSPFKLYGDRFIPSRTHLEWNIKSGLYNDIWSTPSKRKILDIKPCSFTCEKGVKRFKTGLFKEDYQKNDFLHGEMISFQDTNETGDDLTKVHPSNIFTTPSNISNNNLIKVSFSENAKGMYIKSYNDGCTNSLVHRELFLQNNFKEGLFNAPQTASYNDLCKAKTFEVTPLAKKIVVDSNAISPHGLSPIASFSSASRKLNFDDTPNGQGDLSLTIDDDDDCMKPGKNCPVPSYLETNNTNYSLYFKETMASSTQECLPLVTSLNDNVAIDSQLFIPFDGGSSNNVYSECNAQEIKNDLENSTQKCLPKLPKPNLPLTKVDQRYEELEEDEGVLPSIDDPTTSIMASPYFQGCPLKRSLPYTNLTVLTDHPTQSSSNDTEVLQPYGETQQSTLSDLHLQIYGGDGIGNCNFFKDLLLGNNHTPTSFSIINKESGCCTFPTRYLASSTTTQEQPSNTDDKRRRSNRQQWTMIGVPQPPLPRRLLDKRCCRAFPLLEESSSFSMPTKALNLYQTALHNEIFGSTPPSGVGESTFGSMHGRYGNYERGSGLNGNKYPFILYPNSSICPYLPPMLDEIADDTSEFVLDAFVNCDKTARTIHNEEGLFTNAFVRTMTEIYDSPVKRVYQSSHVNHHPHGSSPVFRKLTFSLLTKHHREQAYGYRNVHTSFPTRPRLFKFTPVKDNPIKISPLSATHLTYATEKLIKTPVKKTRSIAKVPYKILDAPDLQDDFYLNLVDWSVTNVLAVGLGNSVYLWNAKTSQVTKLCDLTQETEWKCDVDDGVPPLTAQGGLVMQQTPLPPNAHDEAFDEDNDAFINLPQQRSSSPAPSAAPTAIIVTSSTTFPPPVSMSVTPGLSTDLGGLTIACDGHSNEYARPQTPPPVSHPANDLTIGDSVVRDYQDDNLDEPGSSSSAKMNRTTATTLSPRVTTYANSETGLVASTSNATSTPLTHSTSTVLRSPPPPPLPQQQVATLDIGVGYGNARDDGDSYSTPTRYIDILGLVNAQTVVTGEGEEEDNINHHSLHHNEDGMGGEEGNGTIRDETSCFRLTHNHPTNNKVTSLSWSPPVSEDCHRQSPILFLHRRCRSPTPTAPSSSPSLHSSPSFPSGMGPLGGDSETTPDTAYYPFPNVSGGDSSRVPVDLFLEGYDDGGGGFAHAPTNNNETSLLAIGTQTGDVHVWDPVTLKRIHFYPRVHEARIGVLTWCTGDDSEMISTRNPTYNNNTDKYRNYSDAGYVGNTLLCTGSRDRLIHCIDIRIPYRPSRFKGPKIGFGKWKKTYTGHKQEVCGMKWCSDTTHLASGGNDNRLLLWDLRLANEPVQEYLEHTAAVKAITWNPFQRGSLVSGGGTADRTIRFWNTQTADPNSKLIINTGSQVCNLAWSHFPDEFVSTHGYSQNQIIIWKYPSLTQLAVLKGHTFRVLYLALSPDGKSIVTGAGDETLRFWNVFDRPRASKRPVHSILNLFSHMR